MALEIRAGDLKTATRLVSNFLSDILGETNEFEIVDESNTSVEYISAMNRRLLETISYMDFRKIDPETISKKLGMPARAVRKGLDRLVKTKAFRLYNMIYQADLKNSFVFAIIANGVNQSNFKDRIHDLEKTDGFSEKQIFSIRQGNHFRSVIHSNSIGEIEKMEILASGIFKDVIIARRFNTMVNPSLVPLGDQSK